MTAPKTGEPRPRRFLIGPFMLQFLAFVLAMGLVVALSPGAFEQGALESGAPSDALDGTSSEGDLLGD